MSQIEDAPNPQSGRGYLLTLQTKGLVFKMQHRSFGYQMLTSLSSWAKKSPDIWHCELATKVARITIRSVRYRLLFGGSGAYFMPLHFLTGGWRMPPKQPPSSLYIHTIPCAMWNIQKTKKRGSNRSLILTCCSPMRKKTNFVLLCIIFKCLYAKKIFIFEGQNASFPFPHFRGILKLSGCFLPSQRQPFLFASLYLPTNIKWMWNFEIEN